MANRMSGHGDLYDQLAPGKIGYGKYRRHIGGKPFFLASEGASGEDGLGELAGAGEDGVHEVKAVGTKMSKHGKVAAGVPVQVKQNGRRYFSNPGIG